MKEEDLKGARGKLTKNQEIDHQPALQLCSTLGAVAVRSQLEATRGKTTTTAGPSPGPKPAQPGRSAVRERTHGLPLGLLGTNPRVRSPSPNYLGLNLEHRPRPGSITSSTSTAPPGPPEEDRHHELAYSSTDGHVTLKEVLGPCTPGPPAQQSQSCPPTLQSI